jgi:4-amino-4-deoxy-L-arabinose transferase-like glycosyltransferase
LRALVGRLRTDAGTRFLVAWLLGPLILFELVRTKLVHYWLPAYPAGVLLVTAWLFQSGARALPFTRLGAAAAWLTVIAGLILAGAPAAAGRYFDLDEMVPPALIAALPLLVGLLVFAGTARSRLRLGTTALAVGAALQLAIVAGPCLRRLSEAVVEQRAARALLAARATGEAVVVYRVRAADALVALPLGTAVCAAPECVDTLVTAHGQVVGVGSGEGVAELHRRRADLRIAWLAAVTGLDLVHGRWERWIVFRVGRDGETAS